jgi:hypothetical protein
VFLLCGALSVAIWTGLYAMALSPQRPWRYCLRAFGPLLIRGGDNVLLIACQRYFLAPYLLTAVRSSGRTGHPTVRPGAKGHKTALAVFALSFWVADRGGRHPTLGLYTLPYRLAASVCTLGI